MEQLSESVQREIARTWPFKEGQLQSDGLFRKCRILGIGTDFIRDPQAERDAAAWQKVRAAMCQWANWQQFDGTPEQQISAADARDFACDGAPQKLNNMVWAAIADALEAANG